MYIFTTEIVSMLAMVAAQQPLGDETINLATDGLRVTAK